MAERYTSYATSRALREAGAPQGELQSPEGETFWRSYTSKYHEDPGKKLRCQKSEGPMSETDPRAEARKLIEWYKLWNLGQPSREVDWASAVMAKAVRDFAAALRASLEREEQAEVNAELTSAQRTEALIKSRNAIARLTAERDEARAQVAIRDDANAALCRETGAEIQRLRAELARLTTLHTEAEWHEDYGDVIWWRVEADGSINEPPSHVGQPLAGDWPWPGSANLPHDERLFFTPIPRPVKKPPEAESLCARCGETETARGGDLHCTGDCDDAAHGEDGGCHRFIPRPVKP